MSRVFSGLPFTVAPKREYPIVTLGNEEVGTLEVKRYWSLSPAEQEYIKAQKLFNNRKALAELATRISKECGVDYVFAYDRIASAIWGWGAIKGDVIELKETKTSKSGKVVEDIIKVGTVLDVEESADGYNPLLKIKVKFTHQKVNIDGDSDLAMAELSKPEIATIDQAEQLFDEDGQKKGVKFLVDIQSPEWMKTSNPDNYLSEIAELDQAIAKLISTDRIYVYATAILRYRLRAGADVASFEIAFSAAKNAIMRLKESDLTKQRLIRDLQQYFEEESGIWTLEHTKNRDLIAPELVAEVARFAFEEEAGKEATEAAEKAARVEPSPDDLGNSSPPKSEEQTGKQSSGNSSDTIPTIEDSTQPTLPLPQ